MKIRTHKYAELAYPLVNDIKGSSVESKYRTLALTFPTMIMQSGLAQAIGFLMAKNKDEHKELLQHMAILLNEVDSKSLHDKIINSSVTEYQLLSREALMPVLGSSVTPKHY